jgi:hypothetical protein
VLPVFAAPMAQHGARRVKKEQGRSLPLQD